MAHDALLDSIVHRDEEIVAVSKAAGLPVIPTRQGPSNACLHHALQKALGERLYVVHRIDRETSGLVVFARSADAHREWCLAFERRELRKDYLAYVAGRPRGDRGRIDLALHAARKGKARPALPNESGAQPAVTDWELRLSWQRGEHAISSLVLHPHTGRHHQIRVHLRALEIPILWDPLYGQAATSALALEEAPCARLALHAMNLEWPGRPDLPRLAAPLPTDLATLEDWISERWQRH